MIDHISVSVSNITLISGNSLNFSAVGYDNNTSKKNFSLSCILKFIYNMNTFLLNHIEQFLEFGKFTGELRFSHGIKNLFLTENNSTLLYRNSLQDLKSHTVTMYLFFE